jgi:hypothetical protein
MPDPDPDYLSGDGPPEQFPPATAAERAETVAWLERHARPAGVVLVGDPGETR